MEDNSDNPEMPAAISALLQLQTPLLTQDEIADIFNCGRNFVPVLLAQISGVKRFGTGKRGRRVRLPLSQMPPAYVRDIWPEIALLRTSSHQERQQPRSDVAVAGRIG